MFRGRAVTLDREPEAQSVPSDFWTYVNMVDTFSSGHGCGQLSTETEEAIPLVLEGVGDR